jgi:hypothetical protein
MMEEKTKCLINPSQHTGIHATRVASPFQQSTDSFASKTAVEPLELGYAPQPLPDWGYFTAAAS